MFFLALLTGALALAPAAPDEPADPASGDPNAESEETQSKPSTSAEESTPNEPSTTADPPPDSASSTVLIQPFDAVVVPTSDPVVRESCDAVRTPVTNPRELTCTRWRVEWTHKGKIWGALEADSLVALQQKKARHLAFARQYARAFGKAEDTRYTEVSPLLCDQCDPKASQGRWGQGQTFSGLESARALGDARARLVEFETLFYSEHAPNVTEVARLAGERKTASNAKRYAKQLALASTDIATWHAQLHQAELLRSAARVEKVISAMKSRGVALDKGLAALGKQVGSAVAKAHAGAYAQEGTNPAATPTLDVAFDERRVTATYRLGEASSVWFEGTVGLDGSLRGRSLMAPAGGTLTCKEHSEACGYEYIPSMIRFTVREEPRKEVLELWFQRETWVAATPFSR